MKLSPVTWLVVLALVFGAGAQLVNASLPARVQIPKVKDAAEPLLTEKPSKGSKQGGCWKPARSHKPCPVGSIPAPASKRQDVRIIERLVRTIIRTEVSDACHDLDETLASHLLLTDRVLQLAPGLIDAANRWPPDQETISEVRTEIIELGERSTVLLSELRTLLPECRG